MADGGGDGDGDECLRGSRRGEGTGDSAILRWGGKNLLVDDE